MPTPTEGMITEARKGLKWREEFNRGGTRVGAVRARQIIAKENLSIETVKRMNSFFARHEGNKKAEGFSPGEKGYPSAGRIAWALWGGDPGQRWAKQITEREKKKEMNGIFEALEVTRSSSAVSYANGLIRAGKVSESAEWSGPTATAENDYIEANGLEDFGKWYLGRQSEAEPDTKAHFRSPYSDDFKTVSINGLKAIRSRSAQNDEQEIFESAGRMLEEIEKKQMSSRSGMITLRGFSPTTPGRVNFDAGEMYDVNILSLGEAKGHGMMITELTLQSGIELLSGKNLKAYLSHSGANGDRLFDEAGFFSDFYLEEGKIKARQFRALETFRRYDEEKYERLFEMAATAPDSFGVSIVFEGSLFWETSNGGKEEFSIMSERPEDALFEFPTVEPLAISSADFVDQPAANPSLFAKGVDSKPKVENMKTEIELANESASSKLEGDQAPAPAPAEEKPKAAKKKKKELESESDQVELDQVEIDPQLDARVIEPTDQDSEIESVSETETLEIEEEDDEQNPSLEESENIVEELQSELKAAKARIEELEKLHIPEESEAEEEEEPVKELSAEQQIKSLIDEHILANPYDNRSTACLSVARANPELFKTN